MRASRRSSRPSPSSWRRSRRIRRRSPPAQRRRRAHRPRSRSQARRYSRISSRSPTAYAALRVVKFVTDQIDAADAISKLSQKTGVATETLSVLAFAGETADLSLEGLTTTIRGFAKSSGDLAKGNGSRRPTHSARSGFREGPPGTLARRGVPEVREGARQLRGFAGQGKGRDGHLRPDGRASSSRWPTGLRTKGSGASPRRPSAPARSSRTEAGRAAERLQRRPPAPRIAGTGHRAAFGSKVIPALSDVITTLGEMRGEGEKSIAATFGEKAAKFIRATRRSGSRRSRRSPRPISALKTVGVATWEGIEKGRAPRLRRRPCRRARKRRTRSTGSGGRGSGTSSGEDKLDQAEKDRDALSTALRKKREDKEKKRIQLADAAGRRRTRESPGRRGAARARGRGQRSSPPTSPSATRKCSTRSTRGSDNLAPTSPRAARRSSGGGAGSRRAESDARCAGEGPRAERDGPREARRSGKAEGRRDRSAQLNTRKQLIGLDIEREGLARRSHRR
jgi:hypothetical protein